MRARLHNSKVDLKRENDLLLVLGDGRSMPSDLALFLSWKIPHDVAALGRGIKEYPGKVLHWFNADGPSAIAWAKRLINGDGTIKHTLGEVDGFDCDWDLEQPDYNYQRMTNEGGRLHGSSAFFATLAGIELGYEKIILAGCPLDTEGHWYWEPTSPETLGPIWLGLDFMAWIDFRDSPISYRTRSMSGFTAKLLGQATKDWADGMRWLHNIVIGEN